MTDQNPNYEGTTEDHRWITLRGFLGLLVFLFLITLLSKYLINHIVSIKEYLFYTLLYIIWFIFSTDKVKNYLNKYIKE
jgi:hypothetical protein